MNNLLQGAQLEGRGRGAARLPSSPLSMSSFLPCCCLPLSSCRLFLLTSFCTAFPDNCAISFRIPAVSNQKGEEPDHLRLPVAPARQVVRSSGHTPAGQLLNAPARLRRTPAGFGLFASVRWIRSTPRLLRPFRPRRSHHPVAGDGILQGNIATLPRIAVAAGPGSSSPLCVLPLSSSSWVLNHATVLLVIQGRCRSPAKTFSR